MTRKRPDGSRPSPLSTLDLGFGSGALNRVPADKTALVRRDVCYMLAMEANWAEGTQSDANVAWARAVFEEMQRFACGTYSNFLGFMEDADKLLHGAYEDNYERLQAIKATYDPGNLLPWGAEYPSQCVAGPSSGLARPGCGSITAGIKRAC